MAFPRHEGNQQVLAQCHLAVVGARAVGENLASLNAVAFVHQRGLVVAGALVGALELAQHKGVAHTLVIHDGDVVGGDVLDHASLRRNDHVAGVISSAQLHTGTHERSFGAQQRHSLTLHVGTHQCTVSIVMLEERNHSGCHGNHLSRRHVHVVHLGVRDDLHVAAAQANLNALLGKPVILVERGVRLSNHVTVLFVRSEVVDLVGDLPVHNLAVRSLDEAKRVHASVGGQGTDQTNVRTLRSLDRAHAAVVRRVNVADLQASALTGQAARTQRRQTALVGQARQGVVLVQELGQLRGAEELADSRRDRANVDQGGRGDGLRILGRHALTHNTLHAGQTHANLVLDQLADGTQTTVAEVVDVVGIDRDLGAVRGGHGLLTGVQAHQVLDGGQDVLFREGHHAIGVATQAQLAVDLVAADLSQVVALRLEERVLQQSLRGVARRGLARALLAVDLQQSLIGVVHAILFEGGHHQLGEAKAIGDLLRGQAQGLQQHGDRLAALTVDAHADGVALIHVELEPRTAGRDHLHGVQGTLGRGVDGGVEVHARGADELGNNDTLRAVDDERALVGHHREVTDEDRLGLDLTRHGVGEFRSHVQRCRVVDVLILRLVDGGLHVIETGFGQGKGHVLGVVLDRRKLLENLLKSAHDADVLPCLSLGTGAPFRRANEPSEGLSLEV